VRKLTVKNFSVIKDAELEFGKITVLIGPQASGKSLLCKLAYFLGKEILEQAVKSILAGNSFDEFKAQLTLLFGRRFPTYGLPGSTSNAELEAGRYKVIVVREEMPPETTITFEYPKISITFSPDFESLYKRRHTSQPDWDWTPGISRQERQEELWKAFNLLLSYPNVYDALYIPSGRAFFTDTAKGFSALLNADVDPVIKQFASEIVWSDRWRIGFSTREDSVLDEIRKSMAQIARGQVVVTGNEPSFHTLDNKYLPLGLLSSGTQELLPLFNVLDRRATRQEQSEGMFHLVQDPNSEATFAGTKQVIYLEEPEANVFPSTQYELVRLFSRLSHEPNLDFSWVITTHSPYILSAFNNLIEAGQVVRAKPELRNEVARLIPEHFWIGEGDFKAYAIENGILKSIVAEDTGLVSANYLDQVSETIGAEFDELLRLGYVES
jgi:energy-coupling factor transporter ATP-binding protein EcfA2